MSVEQHALGSVLIRQKADSNRELKADRKPKAKGRPVMAASRRERDEVTSK